MVARVHIGETEKGVPVQTCGQLAAVPALGRVRKPGLVMVLEMIRRPGHTVGCGDELEVPVQAAFRANDRARSESRHDVREVELFPEARNEVADGVGSGTHLPLGMVMVLARSSVRHRKSLYTKAKISGFRLPRTIMGSVPREKPLRIIWFFCAQGRVFTQSRIHWSA